MPHLKKKGSPQDAEIQIRSHTNTNVFLIGIALISRPPKQDVEAEQIKVEGFLSPAAPSLSLSFFPVPCKAAAFTGAVRAGTEQQTLQ